MTLTGTLIAESIRPGTELTDEHLRFVKIARWDQGDNTGPAQPRFWTVIDFEADDTAADAVARALADVLLADGGWYCDFRAGHDRVVIFAGKVFRYRRGDAAGRADAEAHGRSVGVPEHQLDWPD
jgi:hypothetical protein